LLWFTAGALVAAVLLRDLRGNCAPTAGTLLAINAVLTDPAVVTELLMTTRQGYKENIGYGQINLIMSWDCDLPRLTSTCGIASPAPTMLAGLLTTPREAKKKNV
jgi:hypothetical protein